MNIQNISDNLKSYISLLIDNVSQNTPLIGFMKPLITRAINKNFDKVTSALLLIADKDGNIDIEELLSEMILSVLTTPKFSVNTSFLGNIGIGEGEIELNIPLVDKRLVLNTDDLNLFKEMIISKQ